ncbi:TPA: Lar family restriction alleviation protein [Pseudomonas aeruginosa]|nr:Lar family restriction alleviation protein [Pseudomonas aeruginosa]HEJ5190772.1 Lar family restriction alleviation protein [Pseudomonas aeruginosa]
MIQAHLVERDQFGFWTHPNYPDLADNCSSNEAQETLRRLGLELQTVFMESDAPRLADSLSPIDLDAAAEQHERLLSEACAKALNQRDAALARVASLESKLAELEKQEKQEPVAYRIEARDERGIVRRDCLSRTPLLKPCPLCGSTNIRMLEPEQFDSGAWNCAVECLDCEVHVGPSYCEPDPVTARYSAQVDWNRRPSAKIHSASEQGSTCCKGGA